MKRKEKWREAGNEEVNNKRRNVDYQNINKNIKQKYYQKNMTKINLNWYQNWQKDS